ncbi:MAG TPA: Hsp20/alpha crystallin family protein [Bryobacteraceae bacterium]|nr:Hsp20/alpha crystallin family protein [Bryobacteraceae bacterium]
MLNTLFATDVRQTLDQFRRSVDQMFENFYSYPAQPNVSSTPAERTWTFSPVLESGWTENFLNLRAILPAVNESDVRVSVQNNQLVLEGERKAPEWFEKNAYTQLAYGKFHTAVTLPAGLDVEHVNCRLHSGVLDIQIPIAEASKPRQIQIQTGESRKAIGA